MARCASTSLTAPATPEHRRDRDRHRRHRERERQPARPIVQFGFEADDMRWASPMTARSTSTPTLMLRRRWRRQRERESRRGHRPDRFPRFTIAAHVTNSGAMNIGAHATANAYDTAMPTRTSASASPDRRECRRRAADVYNTAAGSSDHRSANANGGAKATATAIIGNTEGFGTGIGQLAVGSTNAHAGVVNDGTLSISAVAHANGYSSASANAFAKGIGQAASIDNTPTSLPGIASDTVTNNGTLNVHATAVAAASSGVAAADATVGFGVSQNASGFDASADITNNGGTIDIGAVASATGTAVGVQSLTAGGWGEGNYFVTGGANAPCERGPGPGRFRSRHLHDGRARPGHPRRRCECEHHQYRHGQHSRQRLCDGQ